MLPTSYILPLCAVYLLTLLQLQFSNNLGKTK